ncbi:hypothetical protein DFJ73DRAFT_8502, partial [Zopfochytrium polystomum]
HNPRLYKYCPLHAPQSTLSSYHTSITHTQTAKKKPVSSSPQPTRKQNNNVAHHPARNPRRLGLHHHRARPAHVRPPRRYPDAHRRRPRQAPRLALCSLRVHKARHRVLGPKPSFPPRRLHRLEACAVNQGQARPRHHVRRAPLGVADVNESTRRT